MNLFKKLFSRKKTKAVVASTAVVSKRIAGYPSSSYSAYQSASRHDDSTDLLNPLNPLSPISPFNPLHTSIYSSPEPLISSSFDSSPATSNHDCSSSYSHDYSSSSSSWDSGSSSCDSGSSSFDTGSSSSGSDW